VPDGTTALLTPSRAQTARQVTVLHELPARVRLKVPALRWETTLAERLEASLGGRDGIVEARANPACASLTLRYTGTPSRELIQEWIDEAYDSPLPEKPRDEAPSLRPLICGALTVTSALLGVPPLWRGGLLAVSAWPIFQRAITAVREERRLTVDALDASAIGLLGARGDIMAAGLSSSLIAFGEYIRAHTAGRSRRDLTALLGERERFAWVQRGEAKIRLRASEIQPGDIVIVYSGQMISVDGEVVSGHGLVDQQMLTGESRLIESGPGANVYASTLLADGKLYINTEKSGASTRAHQLVRLLEDAPSQETQMTNYARQFADRLVLPTLALAGGVAVVGTPAAAVSVLLFDFATGIRVSAPTTILASLSSAMRRGVLIKGGAGLERLAKVDTLIFDKTGTLTRGTPTVSDVKTFKNEISPEEVLVLAAAAERRLSHPVAQAITREAEKLELPITERSDSHYTLGLGVAATIDGASVLVGDARLLKRHGVELNSHRAKRNGSDPSSSVLIARERELLGEVLYADQVREEAGLALDALRGLGIKEIHMVTGDDEEAALQVAAPLGIENVMANVFPEDKARFVQELREQDKVVAVVGDGINDSPALAFADVSVSLKGGSDIARETADVVLQDDLMGLPLAIETSREAMQIIRQNLAIVGVPNALGLGLAVLGAAGPIVSTAINNGSSVLAAANGLRPLVSNAQRANKGTPAESNRRSGR
jgi:P-type Cu2+ transporter